MLAGILRLSAIAFLVSGLVWFSLVYGPRYAAADVYLDVGASGGVPSSARSVPRPVVINNQTLMLSHRAVRAPLEQALPPLSRAASSHAVAQQARGVMDRPLELSGGSWKMQAFLPGFLAGEDRASLPGGPAVPAVTRQPGSVDLGLADGDSANVWTLDLPASFDFINLFGDTDGDAPGFELPDISRFPGSRRDLSMEVQGPSGPTLLLAFTGRGQVQERRRYYRSALEAAGLRLEREMVADDGAVVMDLEGEGRRYAVYLSLPESTGMSTDIFQIQKGQTGR